MALGKWAKWINGGDMFNQSLGALGSLAGQFLSAGGVNPQYMKGQIDGATARRIIAESALKEKESQYRDEAIQRGLNQDYRGANAYSLYGYGGKTSYSPTSNGAVFNALDGTLDTATPLAKAFLDKSAADIATRTAQANQYNTAADLNTAKANTMQPLAEATIAQRMAAAAASNATAQQREALIPYEQTLRTAQAQNQFASANEGYAKADQTQALTPYEQALRTARTQDAFASAEQHRQTSGQVQPLAEATIAQRMAAAAASNATAQQRASEMDLNTEPMNVAGNDGGIDLQSLLGVAPLVGPIFAASGEARQHLLPTNQTNQKIAIGTVMDGYVFKGGDPANEQNWVLQK